MKFTQIKSRCFLNHLTRRRLKIICCSSAGSSCQKFDIVYLGSFITKNKQKERMESPKSPKPPRRRTSSGNSKRIKKLSQEQLLLAMQKKRECNAKAQAVVEGLLEPVESPNDFLSKIKNINQCHYQDIIEERAISKLCGYPLCKQKLEEVPAKQFQISTKTNRVYDITDRKNFCSTSCFKASNYIKEQLLTSPLWLRDQEVLPEFKLLSINDD